MSRTEEERREGGVKSQPPRETYVWTYVDNSYDDTCWTNFFYRPSGSSLCDVPSVLSVVWQAPYRAYGFITGYHVKMFSAISGAEGEIIQKQRDEFFHKVVEGNLPPGGLDGGEILIEVSVLLSGS